MSKIPYFQFKIEKNNVNNYLRVKMTSNHINMDINGFSGPKNIRKSILLDDLVKTKKIKIAAAAILFAHLMN